MICKIISLFNPFVAGRTNTDLKPIETWQHGMTLYEVRPIILYSIVFFIFSNVRTKKTIQMSTEDLHRSRHIVAWAQSSAPLPKLIIGIRSVFKCSERA